MTKYICPICNKELLRNDNNISCNFCNKTYKISDGIIDFRKGDEPYWCEVPQPLMTGLLKDVKLTGWRDALLKLCNSRNDKGLFERTAEKNRASWMYLIPISQESTVLDAGSGWGSLTFSLAEYFKSVVSIDSVFERISFVEERRRQENINNIQCICGSVLKMPFADNSFDLVVLNGVLEWLGLSDLSKPVREVQLTALKEINRILKPGGYIYVGIENRFGIDYFFGFKDHHSGLRFSTLMPRFIANIYSRIVKKRDYRTFTYSYSGYRKLLKEAGFEKQSFYVPISNYRKFHYLLPLNLPNSDNSIKYVFTHILPEKLIFVSKIVKKLHWAAMMFFRFKLTWLLKYFVTSYSIMGEKKID